jgi:hypothetical protein
MPKVKYLYENYIPKGNSSHMLKYLFLWGSLTKYHKVFTIVLTIIFTLCLFFQDFFFTYGLFTSFNNN